MKYLLSLYGLFISLIANSQSVKDKLSAAMNNLEKDAQFKHATLSMYVVDSKTGNVVYEKNSETGLAPASCQKVVTSVTAFELLGKDYKYKTSFFNQKELHLGGNDLLVVGSGDPTFGSWRYPETIDSVVLNNLYKALKKRKVEVFRSVCVNDFAFGNTALPRGWIWEDIANYYGAGHYQLNWNENQYDLNFSTQQPGGYSKLLSTKPKLSNIVFNNQVLAGKEGSGDNAYVFFIPGKDTVLIQGTIPPNKNTFTISGAMTDPPQVFLDIAAKFFSKANHFIDIKNVGKVERRFNDINSLSPGMPIYRIDSIYTHFSPPFDSINYWFLKKSINLYGEAFVKTIAFEKNKPGSTDTGINIIKSFWKDKGIEPSALNIIDGSGLSPANRVTTNALATIMQYARRQSWFSSFYYDLPEMNGIKMKDGYIGGVRSYTGYVKSTNGNEYTFSFIVNNFDGSPGSVREKMWKVLDILK